MNEKAQQKFIVLHAQTTQTIFECSIVNTQCSIQKNLETVGNKRQIKFNGCQSFEKNYILKQYSRNSIISGYDFLLVQN